MVYFCVPLFLSCVAFGVLLIEVGLDTLGDSAFDSCPSFPILLWKGQLTISELANDFRAKVVSVFVYVLWVPDFTFNFGFGFSYCLVLSVSGCF